MAGWVLPKGHVLSSSDLENLLVDMPVKTRGLPRVPFENYEMWILSKSTILLQPDWTTFYPSNAIACLCFYLHSSTPTNAPPSKFNSSVLGPDQVLLSLRGFPLRGESPGRAIPSEVQTIWTICLFTLMSFSVDISSSHTGF